MKIVDEKGKLFGLVNLVDLLMVAALVLVAAALFILMRGGQEEEEPFSGEYVTMEYTVRVRMEQREGGPTIQEQLARSIKETDMPHQLVAEQSFVDNFYLTGYTIHPAVYLGVNTEGRPVYTSDDNRRDVVFTMRGIMDEPSGAIYRVATQEVRVGRSYFVKTQLFELSGIVESLTITPVAQPAFVENEDFDADDPSTWGWHPDDWDWAA